MKKILVPVFIFLCVSGNISYADGDGGLAGAFLRMGIGARAKALGDAFAAVPEGSAVSLYNPAALTRLRERAITLSSTMLPLDRRLDYVGFAQTLRPKLTDDQVDESAGRLNAGFALGWVHAGVDKIDGRDSNGNHIGNFSNSEHAFYFSFALQPHHLVSLGLNAKVLYNRFPGLKDDDKAMSARNFGMDLGIFVTPVPGLCLAAVVRDLTSKYSWNSEGLWERATSTIDKFPRRVRLGAAYRLPAEWCMVVFDVEDSYDLEPEYHLGTEVTLKKVGAIRLGLDDGMVTAGFGLVIPKTKDKLQLNYGFWSEPGGAGSAHIFDLLVSFPER